MFPRQLLAKRALITLLRESRNRARPKSPRLVVFNPTAHMRIILALLAFATTAEACDCPPLAGLADRYSKASDVVIARIVSARFDQARIVGLGEVLESLKGSSSSFVEIAWHTPHSDCWTPVNVGAEYLVFLDPASRPTWWSGCQPPVQPHEVPRQLLRDWRD